MTASAPTLSALGEVAIGLARKGYRVFPLAPRTKVPLLAGGRGCLDATSDLATVRAWWTQYPDANVGLATGAILVLDKDNRNGGEASLAALVAKHGPLPETPRVYTGSGDGSTHEYLRAPPGAVIGSKVLAPGVDLKGAGGYVVAPGSVHPSGGLYTWDPANDLATPMAECPAWVLAAAEPAEDPGEGIDAKHSYLGAAFEAAGMLGKRLADGRRKVLCPWRGEHSQGKDYDSSTVLFPPRAGSSLGWFKCSHSHCGARSYLHVLQELPADARGAADKAYPKRAPEARASARPGAPPASVAEVWKFVRGDHVEIAEALRATIETSPVTLDEGEVWRYGADGVWRPLARAYLEHLVTGFAGHALPPRGEAPRVLSISDGHVRGAVRLAKNALEADDDRLLFANAPRGLAFANGFARVEPGRVVLEPHVPEHLARFAHAFDYDPRAPRDLLTSFFDAVFGDCSEEEKAERVMCLQEFVGCSLLGLAPSYQKALVLYGTGNNGKSQALEIARAGFPPGSVASLAPTLWAERFQAANLVGALANFVDEMPSHDVSEGSVFKSIITGEPITVERKGRDPFLFYPRAGHIFSANTLPSTRDHSVGFHRRFTLCVFSRDMSQLADRRADVGKAVAAAELPGIVAWALEGAARRVGAESYTESAASRALRDEWHDESDPVRLFLKQHAFPTLSLAAPIEHGRIRARDLYTSYRTWSEEGGYRPVTETKFGTRSRNSGLVGEGRDKGGRFYFGLSEVSP